MSIDTGRAAPGTTEPFRVYHLVTDTMAEDAELLAELERNLPGEWAAMCREAGADPAGAPTVTRDKNLGYGAVHTLDDGQQATDRVLFTLMAIGPAVRRS